MSTQGSSPGSKPRADKYSWIVKAARAYRHHDKATDLKLKKDEVSALWKESFEVLDHLEDIRGERSRAETLSARLQEKLNAEEQRLLEALGNLEKEQTEKTQI